MTRTRLRQGAGVLYERRAINMAVAFSKKEVYSGRAGCVLRLVWSIGGWSRNAASGLVLLVLVRPTLWAQDHPLPRPVTEALEANARALSPITVEWVETLGSELPVREWLQKVGEEPFCLDVFQPTDVTYCWQEGMIYECRREKKVILDNLTVVGVDGEVQARPGADPNDARYAVVDREAACDLTRIFVGDNREALARGELGSILSVDFIKRPKFFTSDSVIFDPAYFREAGFELPIRINAQGEDAESSILALLRRGSKLVKYDLVALDGHECALVELSDNETRRRFYLDPSRLYAVVRGERLAPTGALIQASTLSDFVLLRAADTNVWLPKHCSVAYHHWPTMGDAVSDEPIARATIAVQEMAKGPIAKTRFSLRYTAPGTEIADSTLDGAENVPDGVVRYAVPANPADLDAAVQAALERKRFVPSALRQRSHPVLLLNLAVVAVLFLAYLLRRGFSRGKGS